jgi:hypothetical protein
MFYVTLRFLYNVVGLGSSGGLYGAHVLFAMCRQYVGSLLNPLSSKSIQRAWSTYTTRLITAPIARPILPPLIRPQTIKVLLPQFLVHLIMPFTQPPAQPNLPTDVWRVAFQVLSEIVRTVCARVQQGQRADQGEHVGALRRRRAVGVISCCCMQERPRRAPELLHVRRTVGGRHIGTWRGDGGGSRGHGRHHGRRGRVPSLPTSVVRLDGAGAGLPVSKGRAYFAWLSIWAHDHAWGNRVLGIWAGCWAIAGTPTHGWRTQNY